jgi:hypothetical protein
VLTVEVTQVEPFPPIKCEATALDIKFKDVDGQDYVLVLAVCEAEDGLDASLDIDLTYPNGHTLGLESITVMRKES